MMNDLKDMLEMLSEKGYTPSEFMILYELSCYDEFIELEEDKKKEVCDAIYSEYIGCEITSIEELTRTAIDHLDELLTNENFDFFRYL
jgi:hypothetical protein